MDRIETPIILLSAVIVIVNIATVFKTDTDVLNDQGFSSIKPTDYRSQRECVKIRSRAQCTSAYGQFYINALSKCGTHGSVHINYTESQCRQNHNGDYCGVVLSSSSVSGVILDHCTDPKTCPQGCAEILRSTLDFVGCCFTGSAFTMYFNSCGISLRPACPLSPLIIPKVKYDSSCSTTEQFQKREYIATCDNMPLVLDALIAARSATFWPTIITYHAARKTTSTV